MTTFVLVHGAWGGSYMWRKIRARLQAAGHEVFTPSLTGLGERAHLASPQVTLTTHVADVVNAILYEDLKAVVLVGYSYGGMVVTGALAAIAERVAHLVYVDAFVPADGESLLAMVGQPVPPVLGKDWLSPPPARELEDPAEAAWFDERSLHHPKGCFGEPVRLARALEDFPFTRTYVKAIAEERTSGSVFWKAADRAKNDLRWTYREIAGSHALLVDRPAELTAILLERA